MIKIINAESKPTISIRDMKVGSVGIITKVTEGDIEEFKCKNHLVLRMEKGVISLTDPSRVWLNYLDTLVLQVKLVDIEIKILG